MKYIAFTLSMPHVNTWNSHWSGEGNFYAKVVSVPEKQFKKLPFNASKKQYFDYEFSNVWVASVKAELVDSSTARTFKRKSKGFLGYDWMVDSIMKYGKIRDTRNDDKIEAKESKFMTLSQLKRIVSEAVYEESSDALIQFGAKVLAFGMKAHFWHLNCDTNSAHLALKDFYETCDDTGDKILEAALSKTSKAIESAAVDEVGFKALKYDASCVAEIEKIRDEAEGLVAGKDNGMDNIISDFIEACDSTVYKLKRLS